MTTPSSLEKFVVIIPTYRRAEMLRERIKEISNWNRLKRLVLSVDGLRQSSDRNEAQLNQEVINVARSLALKDSRIQVLEWKDNQGLNIHFARIFEKFKSESSVLIVEEDTSVDTIALDFLADNSRKKGSLAASGYVRQTHSRNKPDDSFKTLFPLQWGLSITSEVMEHYLYVMRTGNFNKSAIRKVFRSQLSEVLQIYELEKLIQWWFNHFYFARHHGNFADALIQYSVYSNLGFYRAPAWSLVKDVARNDDLNSLTPRIASNDQAECAYLYENKIDGEFECLGCQIRHSHLEETGLIKLARATRFRRTNPLFHNELKLDFSYK